MRALPIRPSPRWPGTSTSFARRGTRPSTRWRCTSKEAYASGIADLETGLHNWSDAKAGRRKGARVGFPRFKARHRDRGRVRFTTGAMRLEPDRRHLTVPVIGKLPSKENTRRLERLVVKGRARILSMTLSQCGGRLVVAVQAIVALQPRHPAEPGGRCGVDLGIGLEWAVIAHHDGTIERVAHPRLARRYGTVVVEDLDVAAMQRSMGRRALHRTVSQAGIGRVRPTLAYKCPALGGRLVVADRWFGSSKSHHGCGGYCADLKLGGRLWSCPRCERLVDRNANAALNLRDWTGAVDTGKADADGEVQRGGVAARCRTWPPKRATHGGQAHAPA
jgi:putative transposase